MQEIGKDLVRLCTLLHTKNELHSARHRARHIYIKLNTARCNISLFEKRRQLEKQANESTNPDIKKVSEISSLADKLNWWVGREIANATNSTLNKLKNECKLDAERLAKMPHVDFKRIAIKFVKMKKSDLDIEVTKAMIAREQTKLDIKLFTKQNRKEIADICKRNKWVVGRDRHSAFYNAILPKVNKSQDKYDFIVMGRKDIANIAANSLFEDAMTKEVT